MKKLAVLALSLLMALGGIAPAHAFPSIAAAKIDMPDQVQEVRDHRRWRHRRGNAGAIIGGIAAGAIIAGALAQPRYDYERRHRRYYDDGYYNAPRYYRGGYYEAPRYYRYERRHYAPRHRVVRGNPHVNWCHNRYRSYRAWDNTFQPYHGPRRHCYSPYS